MGLETGFTGERLIVLPSPFIELMKDNPLTGDLYICSLGHITHAKHHVVDRPKGSDTYIFLYCVWGKGLLTIEKQKMILTANQFIILPKNVPLSYISDDNDPWSIYWICFDGTKANIYSKLNSKPSSVLPSIYMRIEQRIELFDKIYSVLCGKLSLSTLNYANQIFPHFLATFIYSEETSAEYTQPKYSQEMVNKVVQYMNNNAERKLTIKELANYAGYSESYFYRQFINSMSISPIEYFIKIKINKAAIMLLKTKMSIAQISAKLAFGSADYFSRAFKKELGITPSEFRKQNFRL